MEDRDSSLMQRFARKGDREALGRLFTRHAPEAYRTARLILRDPGAAEDAVQEAFSRLIAKASSYDPSRPFLPWLRSLVAHAALDRAKSERRRTAREALSLAEKSAEDPSMRLIDAETLDRLRGEIDALPEDLRLPVSLHYQAGYSYVETAEALGCPEGTVATRLAAARERLKAALAASGAVLAAGVSLEDAAAASAPPVGPVSATLSAVLQALAASATPPAIPPASPLPSSRPMLLAAAGVLLLAAGFLTLRDLSNPSSRPAPAPGPPRPPAPGPLPVAPTPRTAPHLAEAPAPRVPDARPVGHGGTNEEARLKIRVVCKETGLPIRDARVHALFLSHGFGAKTNDRGEAALEAVAGRPYRLEVTAPGFSRFATGLESALHPSEATDWDPSSSGLWKEATETPLRTGETLERTVSLSRGWGVLLRLLGEDGRPIREPSRFTCRIQGRLGGRPHAYVIEGNGPPLHTGRTERRFMPYGPGAREDGLLEFGGLDPDGFPVHEARLTMEIPGFLPGVAESLHALPFLDGRYSATLRLDPGRILRGRVFLPGGGPAGRADVLMAVKGKVRTSVSTDPEGRFEIRGLDQDQAVQLWARMRGAEPACLEAPLDVPAGTDPGNVDLRLSPGATVSGQVVDAKGLPARPPGGWVEARIPVSKGPWKWEVSVTTDEFGRFTFRGIPPWGSLEIHCCHPDLVGSVGWSGVPPGTDGVEIRLPHLGTPGKVDHRAPLKPWTNP